MSDLVRWSDKWPKEQRQLAHKLVAQAKKGGKLICQPSQVCGARSTVAHHEDYDEPLAVQWLCDPPSQAAP